MRRVLAVTMLALAAVCAPAAAPAQRTAPSLAGKCIAWCTDTVAPGVVWRQATLAIPDSTPVKVLVNVLDVDLAQPGVSLLPVRAPQGTYQPVSTLGTGTKYAAGGVNGGFFLYGGTDDICDACKTGQCPAYRPSSLLQIDGTPASTNCLTARTALGIDALGAVHFSVIPADSAWTAMKHAVGAGPTLVTAGIPTVSTNQQFPWLYTQHPRTAVALARNGHLLLVTVDSPGLTLPGLANFLIQTLNASHAMNFDGGGSTTMWVAGEPNHGVVNCPSAQGCTERAVYDGLFVVVGGA